MLKLIALVIVLIVLVGAGYYVYTHGWKKPEDLALFSHPPATRRRLERSRLLLGSQSALPVSISMSIPAMAAVTLSGRVPSEDAKSLAGEIARDTPGVTDVKNEIAIEPGAQPSSESVHVEDLEIRVAILEALAHSRELGGKSIDVKVDNRTVTLSGTVETPRNATEPRQIARAVDGVAGVTNNLTATNPQAATEPPAATSTPADSTADLAKRVEFELYRTGAFNTLTIQVKAEESTVTLSGNVRLSSGQLLAERVAQSVAGVKKVTNDLKVAAAASRQ